MDFQPFSLRLRKMASEVKARFLAGKAPPTSDIRPGLPLVAGFLSTSSGIGQSARLCLRALQAMKLSPRSFDLAPRFGISDMPWPDGNPLPPGEDEGPLILHANAPEVLTALATIGRRRTRHRKLIGFWAWELPTFPLGWDACAELLHEIWVPSHFVRLSLAGHCGLPVKVIPHPIFPPVAGPSPRHHWGWPEDEFVVLTMFDMRSSFQRKNPVGAVRAFLQAFGDSPRVRLVIKVGNAAAFPNSFEQLRQEIGSARNIQVLTEVYSQDRMVDLIAAADVVLSLHRAEGFGLTLAEAMALGKPVVATAWSGNMDFMSPEIGTLVRYKLQVVRDPHGPYAYPDAKWAEPDIDDASRLLRQLRESPDWRHDLGERSRAAILESHGLASYARAYQKALALDTDDLQMVETAAADGPVSPGMHTGLS